MKIISIIDNNDKLNAIVTTIKDGSYKNNYSDTVNELVTIFKHITRDYDTERGTILAKIKSLAKKKGKVSVTSNLILQDVVTILTTDRKIDFSKYLFLENTKSKDSNNIYLNITVPNTINVNVTLEDELEILFSKLGVEGIVTMLRVLDKVTVSM